MIATDGDITIAKCDVCGTQRTAIGEEAWKKLAAHLATHWAKFGGRDLCHACDEVRRAHMQSARLRTEPRAETAK